MQSLHELFLDQLQDIYYAEKQLIRALPKMKKAANDDGLRQAFGNHLEETEGHAESLEEAFRSLGLKEKSKKCQAIIGILKEGDELVADFKKSPALDAALIAAAQKVEHYEIATYGCLHAWAVQMGHEEVADILERILGEEKKANETLTELAEVSCNPAASPERDGGMPKLAAGQRIRGKSTQSTRRLESSGSR